MLTVACASQPKPCTPEWIEYRTDRTLSRFASENRPLVRDLRNLVRSDGRIDPVQAILLSAKADDLQRFARSFESVIVPEINSAVAQCGRDAGFVPAFTEFLRRQGVGEPALEWVGPMLAIAQVIQSEQPAGTDRR
jgi:hypothetical protein